MSYKLDRKNEKEIVKKLIKTRPERWSLSSSHILMCGNLPVKIGFYGPITLEVGMSTIRLRLLSRIKLASTFSKIHEKCKKEKSTRMYKEIMKAL